ncbi:MAG TPA: transporter [Ferruginibacter sp.]|nr:transporter [Ferruginibacter sp.]HMP20715.1 transporter [Ferruginibacter sp.]
MTQKLFYTLVVLCCSWGTHSVKAQTDIDAIMMGKRQLCIGPMYSYTSWNNYWEGTLKRSNENLGTVSAQMFSIMGNYGITDKLNFLFGVPYIKTKASAGTLHSMQGVQDLNLFLKWMPIEKEIGKGTFSVYTIGGISFPLTNYVADFLPLSIGLRSKTASARLMLDYQVGNIFITASGTYVGRDNITIDRNSYYTTQLILSNEVEMPNATSFNFRAGWRSDKLIAEAVLNKWTTLGGFDISRNNMPFPSNRMNATTLGFNFKYVLTANHALSLTGGFNTAIAGRNMGQGTMYNGGIFYVLDFVKTKKNGTQQQPEKID